MMGNGYWSKKANGLPTAADNPWAILVRDTLKQVNQTLYENLERLDELEAFSIVKADDMHNTYNRLLAEGSTEAEARELAFDDHLPSETPQTEDYELEGGQEDEAAAFENWIKEG